MKPSLENRPEKECKAILEVRDLCLSYQKKRVLENLDFSVQPGGFVSIIGPNGSGKTTLVKAVSRNQTLESGSIHLNGTEINALSQQALARQMAVVMQAVEPVAMGVAAYVLLGRMPFFEPYQFFERQKDIDIAQKYMDLTHTSRLADSRMDQISGGERQLASIARALTQEPCLLVLDEPTAHLDITHQVRVLELIRTLGKELGLTVLMVLHDLNLAAEYSDGLILLNKDEKRIHSMGTPDQVLTREAIRAVYHTDVLVRENPESGKPCIFLTRQKP